MQCDRDGCEHVCCEYCVEGRWYLCTSCAKEFINVLVEANKNKCTEKYFYKKLDKFLKSKFGTFSVKMADRQMNVKEYFKEKSRFN